MEDAGNVSHCNIQPNTNLHVRMSGESELSRSEKHRRELLAEISRLGSTQLSVVGARRRYGEQSHATHLIERTQSPLYPPGRRVRIARICLRVVVRDRRVDARASRQHERRLEEVRVLPAEVPLADEQKPA